MPLAEQEGFGVVQEANLATIRCPESRAELRAKIDSAQPLELVGDTGHARAVVERTGNGNAEANDVRPRNRPCRMRDGCKKLGPISGEGQRQPDAASRIDGAGGEFDAARGDMRPTDVERTHDLRGHGMKAFTTLHAPPRTRRMRYRPTAAGTTIVSA